MSAAMTETHTPLRLNAGDETRIMEDHPDGVCLPVCDVKCGGMSGRTVKEGEALATRIAQAVNSHHDLIEALRHVTACLVDELGNLADENEVADEDLAAVLGIDYARQIIAARLRIRQARAILTKEAGR